MTETGAIVAVTVQDAWEGDTATLPETLTMASEQVEAVQPEGRAVAEVVADMGTGAVLGGLGGLGGVGCNGGVESWWSGRSLISTRPGVCGGCGCAVMRTLPTRASPFRLHMRHGPPPPQGSTRHSLRRCSAKEAWRSRDQIDGGAQPGDPFPQRLVLSPQFVGLLHRSSLSALGCAPRASGLDGGAVRAASVREHSSLDGKDFPTASSVVMP